MTDLEDYDEQTWKRLYLQVVVKGEREELERLQVVRLYEYVT